MLLVSANQSINARSPPISYFPSSLKGAGHVKLPRLKIISWEYVPPASHQVSEGGHVTTAQRSSQVSLAGGGGYLCVSLLELRSYSENHSI